MSVRNVVILGSSGSVGRKAVDVAHRYRDQFRVVGLAVGKDIGTLEAQSQLLGVSEVAVADLPAAAELRSKSNLNVAEGRRGIRDLAEKTDADLILNAVVGRAGLEASFAAAASGRTLALANKESLVLAGEFLMSTAAAAGTQVIPIDSEHSGLFQLLEGRDPNSIRRLVITASGGPFRGMTPADLIGVTPDQALNHPIWPMGPRITVDSATLFNKGMEVIETHHLFSVPLDAVHVYVHPQAMVHSLVDFVDGSSLAQLSAPDMLMPVQYAMTYPERLECDIPVLDLAACGKLEFEAPDLGAFPALSLAYEAARRGGTAPAVMNAADEVAVEAFLQERLSFPGIVDVIGSVMEGVASVPADSLQAVDDADSEARRKAKEFIGAP